MFVLHRLARAVTVLALMLGGEALAADVDLYGDPLPPGALARLGTKRLQLSSVVRQIAYSPDGKTLVSASVSIRVWDAKSGRLIRESSKEPGSMIRGLAISPDGEALAWAGRRDTIQVEKTKTGEQILALAGFSECVGFSPDGKTLATNGSEGTIQFWDSATGKELRTLDNPGTTTYLAYPDGKSLISFSGQSPGIGECRLWDLAAGTVRRQWQDIRAPTLLSPDGKTLAAGTNDYGLKLWDLASGKELRKFDLPRPRIRFPESARCAAFSADSKLLAVGDMTSRVHVWELRTGKEVFCSPPLLNLVTCLAFSPDGKTLAVGAWRRILLWDSTTGKDRLPRDGHSDQVGRVAFAPDGKAVATQSIDGTILWDPLTGRQRQKIVDHGTLVGYSPDGNLLLGEKGSIVWWNVATNKTIRAFKSYDGAPPPYPVRVSAVFSRNGKLMVSGSEDRTIRMWNPENGEQLWSARRTNKDRRFPADIGGHWPLGFTHDGKAVVSLGQDAVIRFWDAATGKELRWFRIDSSEAVLSPDGRFLVAVGKHVADPDGKSETRSAAPPRSWDLTKEGQPRPIELYPSDASAPAFSPNSEVVAVAVGPEIVLIKRANAKVLRRLKGHDDYILGIAFSTDGRYLVSGSYDATALVWDVHSQTGKE